MNDSINKPELLPFETLLFLLKTLEYPYAVFQQTTSRCGDFSCYVMSHFNSGLQENIGNAPEWSGHATLMQLLNSLGEGFDKENIQKNLKINGKHDQLFFSATTHQYMRLQLFKIDEKRLLLFLKTQTTNESSANPYHEAQAKQVAIPPETQKRLNESERKYRIIFKNARIGLFYYNRNLVIQECNETFVNLLGSTYEKVNGLDMSTLNDRSVLPAIRSVFEGEEGYYEGAYETSTSGRRIYIRLRTQAVVKENGEVISGLGIAEDVSQRIKMVMQTKLRNEQLSELYKELEAKNRELKSINKRLAISENRFRQLAENMHDVFWLADKHTFVFLNDAFRKVWGVNPDVVQENPATLLNYVYEKDRKRVESLFLPAEESNKIKQEYIYRIVPQEGTTKWLWTRRYTVQEGSQELYAAITTDISDLKQTEEKLIAAMKKAEESDQLKTAFLANISHEIRTPLNSILGFSENLLLDEHTYVKDPEQLQIIYNSGKQLLHIINDLVEIAKVEANQLALHPDNCNLNKLLDDLKAEMPGHLKVYNREHLDIQVVKALSDENALIYTDDNRIRQIFSNLLNNAIKYTESGGISFGYDVNNDMIRFWVSDSGIGISADKRDAIFERFRQIDSHTSAKFGGTGLGLTISRAYANLLGGDLWLGKTSEKGSTFYFTIPYKEARLKRTKPETAELYEYLDWSDKNLLIVEDNASNFRLLKTILKTTNINIFQAVSGEEALEAIEAYSFHLVLMDIRLPGISGNDAMKHIRETHPDIPVIAQTAHAMSVDEAILMNEGFDAYIAKPISRQKLISLLHKYL